MEGVGAALGYSLPPLDILIAVAASDCSIQDNGLMCKAERCGESAATRCTLIGGSARIGGAGRGGAGIHTVVSLRGCTCFYLTCTCQQDLRTDLTYPCH